LKSPYLIDSYSIRCINTLNPLDKGEVYLRVENPTEKEANLNYYRTKIGMVFQHFNLFSHLTALDNVSISLKRVLELPEDEAKERAREALKTVRLGDRKKPLSWRAVWWSEAASWYC
jgi:polar amino acid transport system ATP-binding protein